MKSNLFISVCSRSFSNNSKLRNLIEKKFKHVQYNFHTRLKNQTLIKFLKNSDGAIIGLEKIDNNIVKKLPQLKFISKYGVGINNIDLHALAKNKIKLGWQKGVNKRSVSELTLALILNHCRKIKLNSSNNNILKWNQIIGVNLSSMKVGVIGCGNVGKDLVKLLVPFGCKIMVNDIKSYDNFYKKYNVIKSSLNDLLKKVDVISIHTPLNHSTKNLINENNLKLIKKNCILINTARGGIVNENAILNFLKLNKSFSAAFDVFDNEPNINREFLKLPNFIALPHIGGSTEQSILAMGRYAIKGLLQSKKVNLNKNYE